MPFPPPNAYDIRSSVPIECFDTREVLSNAKEIFKKFIEEVKDLHKSGELRKMSRQERHALMQWEDHMRSQILELEMAITRLSN